MMLTNIKHHLPPSIAIALIGLLCAVSHTLAGTIDLPNIIFILADDMGWKDHSMDSTTMGNKSDFYETPNLNRLASEGLSFNSCYMHPNCAPTRAAILSGQYPARSANGVYNVAGLNRGSGTPTLVGPSNREDIPATTQTLAESLKAANYVTAHFGKYHVGGHEGGDSTLPLNQGYDYNYGGTNSGGPGSYFANSSGIFAKQVSPELDAFGARYTNAYIADYLTPYANGNNPATLNGTNKHISDAMVDAFVSFMDHHRAGPKADKPVYVQFWHYAVHYPIQPRSDLLKKYQGLPVGSIHSGRQYAALMEGLDHTVGRIMDYLDDPNGDGDLSDSISQNTLLIFTSDNGVYWQNSHNTPLRGYKGMFYEGGIRVPMVARMPGTIPANTITNTMVHALDLYPTFLEISGSPAPSSQPLDGVSFAAHLADPSTARARAPIFYHFPGYMDSRARPMTVIIKEIDGKRYKLLYYYDYSYSPNTAHGAFTVLEHPWEMYNLTDDLSETNNLLDGDYWKDLTHRAITDELAADLIAWLTKSEPTWQPSYTTVRATGLTSPPPSGSAPLVIPAPAQHFHIQSASFLGDHVTLDWVSAPGYTFAIQVSVGMGRWQNLVTGIPSQGTSTSRTFTDSQPRTQNLPRRSYRVAVTGNP